MKQPTIKEILAANLEALMAKNSLEQKPLSLKSGRFGKVSQKTISNILSRNHYASLKTIEALADIFGVTPAEIISPGMEFVKYEPDRRYIHEAISRIPQEDLSKAKMVISAFDPEGEELSAPPANNPSVIKDFPRKS
jgi:transcriptional regulator with XRE-family HTH domain